MIPSRTRRVGKILVWLMIVQMVGGFAATAYGQASEAERRKLQEKLMELERKKREMEEKARKRAEESGPKGEELAKIIEMHERLLDGCKERKSERCADVMFTLAGLYYNADKDAWARGIEDYEKKMDQWDRTRVGPEPVRPLPDYSRSLRMYRNLVIEYPSFGRNDEANFQVGNILRLAGELDSSRQAFRWIVEKTPNSIRASAAHFNLADFCYLDHDYSCALKHLEKVKRNEVQPDVWEGVHFRKAELLYNQAEFDKAAELFHSYVEACDKGEYVKKQFREDALTFMAVAFSDMPNGATEAMRFFKRVGKKPYEAQVIYMIGSKNRDHGQWDDAIVALQAALKNYPYYKDAPIAQHKLVECFVVKKELEKANQEREKLVDNYGPGSQWYAKNSGEAAVLDQAKVYVKKALANICLHYHAIAQKSKDKAAYEKALKRYNEYFDKFKDDKWQIYEFRAYVAEIYNDLQQFDKAVENYWFVATEDLSKYPEYKAEDVDSLLFDDAKQFEEEKQKQKRKTMAISQEDAGYNAIVALDKARKKKIAQNSLNDQQAYALPETQRMLDYINQYETRFPKSNNTPQVLYLAGNLHYMAKANDKAIASFKSIIDKFPKSEMADKAFRMIALCYMSAGDHDLAIARYKELLKRTDPKTQDYAEIVDLAAAALYSKAESMQKGGNHMGAADIFKSIFTEYPKSKVADRGWFEAAVSYEQANNFQLAAATFEELPVKFSKSTLRERAFVRAAENYKKLNKFEKAAEIHATAAATITKADFAIGSLADASEAYQKAENFAKAGEMFEIVFQRYMDDARAPQSLYNAGLVFEKGKLYDRAVKAYSVLAEKYPKHELAEEAAFAIGECYLKMGQFALAADAFRQFGKNAGNRAKQVEALVKAGDAYFEMRNFSEAENSYLSATALYDNFKKKADFNTATVAKAYMKLGETYHQQYKAIELKGRNEKEVKSKVDEKAKALEKVLKQYASAIETGIQDVVIKSTYLIGESFMDFAEALRNQTLFGRRDEQVAGKIRVILSLDKYYIRAQEKFQWNVLKAYEQCISNEYVDRSMENVVKIAYLQGRLFEEVGEIFGSAPVPPGLDKEEENAYRDILKEKELEARDKSVPKYEDAIAIAQKLNIAQSPWLDSIRTRIQENNPGSDALLVQISSRAPCTPKVDTRVSTDVGSRGTESEKGIIGFTKGSSEVAPSNKRGAKSEEPADKDDGKKKKKRR